MDATTTYNIVQMTVATVLYASGPILAIALIVGLAVAFFQALTQIQEVTLTFVPKIVAIFGVLLITLPFMFSTLEKLSNHIFNLIITGGV